jgi:RHS repeat-associated protein
LGRFGGPANGYTVDCGSVWSQKFSYPDAFGNITKSGTSSFQATYNGNNQISNMGFVYDLNGNITNDGTNAYTYSVYNRPVTAGGLNATYDAFNRLVEAGSKQLVYAPDGYKFAYMNGQTLQKYVVQLTAGVQAVYTATTPAAPAYWLHSDWLGSTRLSSSPGQTVLADQAYAPFGEGYATYFHGGTNDFTAQTQDVTSGIYDFLFRQYSPTQGRWQTPDPAGTAAVDITNPQTWNRYAYVGNNPLSNIDPQGLSDCDTFIEQDCEGPGGAAGGDPCPYDACVVAPPPDPPSLYDGSNGSDCAVSVNGVCQGDGAGFLTGIGHLQFVTSPFHMSSSIIKSIGSNPCINANPAALNYTAIQHSDGNTAQHIINNHLIPSSPSLTLNKSIYWTPGISFFNTGQAFAWVVGYNALTLTHGVLTSQQGTAAGLSMIIPSPLPPGVPYVGFDSNNKMAPTNINTLVVQTPACTNVINSYPGLPR